MSRHPNTFHIGKQNINKISKVNKTDIENYRSISIMRVLNKDKGHVWQALVLPE